MPGNYFSFVCQLLLICCHFTPFYCSINREIFTSNSRLLLNEYQGKNDHLESYDRVRSYLPGTAGGGATRGSGSEENIFRAVWNVPNYCEERAGVKLPLSDYGIEFNDDGGWDSGKVISLLGDKLGYYPYVNSVDGRFINGGLPQLGNITAHLEKVADDIQSMIPDPDYNGFCVIDWESWYPQWDSIERRYRTYSIEHVRRLHPTWDNLTVDTVAELEWTQGAKLFFESTLKLGKAMRPKALWGFYHYPYCNVIPNTTTCNPPGPERNNEIMWFFNETTCLYPSIYLISKYSGSYASSVRGRLAEALRVRDLSSDPKGPIMSYTRFNYTDTHYFFTLEDLNNTILTSAEFGTNGVIFWGDNYDSKVGSCQELRQYIIDALGPTVVLAREGATACSKRVCSGQGRCVGDILTCSKGDDRQNGKRSQKKVSVCTCRCFVGWQGYDCSTKAKY
ncbi:hyaluronidase-like [Lytechinus pictus]|uniref:hyaluronidase-like n=1 Tax=Lytechinus pictus TaxID=7653 RepID=UPI0030BA1FA8